MIKFEILKKENNGYIWESPDILDAGFNEDFVNDATTDRAKVVIRYNQKKRPNFKVMDWCRIIHDEKNESFGKATYKDVISPVNKIILPQTVLNAGNQTIDRYFSDLTFNGNDIATIESTPEYTINSFEILNPQNIRLNITIHVPTTILFLRINLNSSALPDNHNQYLIASNTKVYDKENEEWKCTLDLIEPIEYLRGILVETRSFTNQTLKVQKDTTPMTGAGVFIDFTYEKDALNHLSVLETILKSTPANNNLEDSWFSRILLKDNTKSFLQNIPFSDDSFSEPSLYDILFNKYDSTTGKTPVLYFNMNPTADTPNINNNGKIQYILEFERQDGLDKDIYQLDNLLEGAGDIINSESLDNYAQSLMSNIENLVTNQTVAGPCEGMFYIPEVDQEVRMLSGFTQISNPDRKGRDWCLRLRSKIKRVSKVERWDMSFQGNVWANITVGSITKVNMPVLEKNEYLAADSGAGYGADNTSWYEEGTNTIRLNNFYYSTSLTMSIYYVEYEPLLNIRIDEGQDYQVQINQIDSQVSAAKIAEYLRKYIDGMDNYDLTFTKTIDDIDYENYIKHFNSRVIDGEKMYLITNLSIVNRGEQYDIIYQLNENHMRKNDSIEAPQQIRENIAIGFNQIKERRTSLLDTIYVSVVEPQANKYKFMNNSNNDSINWYARAVLSALIPATVPDGAYTQLGLVYSTSNLMRRSAETTYGVLQPYTFTQGYVIEIVKFSFGKSVCINFKMFDNAEAGKQKQLRKGKPNPFVSLTPLVGGVESQIPIIYTDPFGEVQKLGLYACKVADFSQKIIDTPIQLIDPILIPRFIAYSEVADIMASLPLRSTDYNIVQASGAFYAFNNMNYYKSMLDILNITMRIKIEMKEKNVIFCQHAIDKCRVLNMRDNQQAIRLFAFDKNIGEKDVLSNGDEITLLQFQSMPDYIRIKYNATLSGTIAIINNAKSIVVTDENKIPLLIINDIDLMPASFKYNLLNGANSYIQLYF